MNNIEFFIKYLNNQPVVINTHINNERTALRAFPIETVAHLIAAYFPETPPNEIALYTLHLPDGVTRAALQQDCFAATDSTGTTLRPGLPLTQLNGIGSDDVNPLIIKSTKDAGQGI